MKRALLLLSTFVVPSVLGVINSLHSVLPLHERQARLLFDVIASSNNPNKYDYLVLLENIPSNYITAALNRHTYSEHNVFDLFEDVVYDAFFVQFKAGMLNLAAFHDSCVRNLHVGRGQFPYESDLLTIYWGDYIKPEIPEMKDRALQLMDATKTAIRFGLEQIYEHVPLEYELFRPYLYPIHPSTKLLPYQSKLALATYVKDYCFSPHPAIFAQTTADIRRRFEHPVFEAYEVSCLKATRYQDLMRKMKAMMDEYDAKAAAAIDATKKKDWRSILNQAFGHVIPPRVISTNKNAKIAHAPQRAPLKSSRAMLGDDAEFIKQVNNSKHGRIPKQRKAMRSATKISKKLINKNSTVASDLADSLLRVFALAQSQ